MQDWMRSFFRSVESIETGGPSVASSAASSPDALCSRSVRNRDRCAVDVRTVVEGSLLGGTALGIATTLERVCFHLHIYGSVFDMCLHGACAIVVGSIGCLMVCASLACFYRTLARWGRAPNQAALWPGFVLGAVSGGLFVHFVIVPSKYGRLVQPSMLAVSGAVLGGLGCMTVLWSYQFLQRWPAVVLGLVLMMAGVAVQVDLHYYLRSYGNMHFAIELALLMGAGFLGAHTSAWMRRRSRWGIRYAVAPCCIGLAVLAVSNPTTGARVAILRYGGVEKSVIRHVLWPALDRDDDGFAAGLWGPDCADRDPAEHPLARSAKSRHLGCQSLSSDSERSPATPLQLSHERATQSVVWFVVDTLRSDVMSGTVHHFSGFTSLTGYRSCGSDTRAVLGQVLGVRGCRPRSLRDSLLTEVRNAGHDVGCFIGYTPSEAGVFNDLGEIEELYPSCAIHVKKPGEDMSHVLRRVEGWIQEEQAKKQAFFALIHLWGGHHPYSGQGGTSWERYVGSVDTTIRAVADLTRRLPTNVLVVVMGDHGEEFGEHDSVHHAATLYEEVVKAPLLVRASVIPDKVQSCPLGCRALVALGYRAAIGEPLTESLCEEEIDGIYAELDAPALYGRGPMSNHLRSLVLPDGLKVIWDPALDIWELYDLSKDPQEQSNLASMMPAALDRAARRLGQAMNTCRPNSLQVNPSRAAQRRQDN